MVLSCGHGGLNRFGHVKVHPVVGHAIDEIDVAADVGADAATTSLCPSVGAVVGRGVG